MNEPVPAPVAPDAAGQPPSGPDAMKAITGVMDVIMNIGDALQGKAPPEALKALASAGQSYKAFLGAMGMPMGEAPAPQGMGAPEVGGNKGAMPAGIPMGPKGTNAVPA